MTAAAPLVWVDVLTSASVSAARQLAGRAGARGIQFLERDARLASPSAESLPVSAIEYDLAVLRTAAGQGLMYALADVLTEYLPDSVSRAVSGTGLADTLGDMPADDIAVALLRAASAVAAPAAALALLARTRPAADRPVLLISADAVAFCGDWPLFQGLAIEAYGVRGGAVRRAAIAARQLITALREVVAAHIVRGIVSSPPDRTVPKIAVQLITDVTPQPVHYPWFSPSGLAGPQLCVYADRADGALDAGARAVIDRERHAWISFRSIRDRVFASRRGVYLNGIVNAVRASAAVIGAAVRSTHALAAWECGHRLALIWRVAFWEAVCRRHRIAAWLQYSETGTVMIAQSIAVKKAGGISAGWQWSHYPFPVPTHARSYSVYFSWGPHYLPLFAAERCRIGQTIYTGMLPVRPPTPADANIVQQRLAPCAASYKVCLFDTSFGGLVELAYARSNGIAFYRRFLQRVVDDPAFALIVKPKNARMPGDAPELTALLARARGTGRLIELAPSVSPLVAARAANLVVGFGVNSAGMQAAVEGCRVIHADLDGDVRSPLYLWGRDRVIFDSLDAVMAAIDIHRAQGAASAIGDHSPIARTLDPFGDDAGHRRVGEYLKSYLDAVTAGASAADAVVKATARHVLQFGPAAAPEESALALPLQRRRAC